MRAKFKYLTIAILFVMTVALCGCHKVAGNYPYYSYIDLIETENGFTIDGYEIYLQEKTYAPAESISMSDNFLFGGTAPRYSISLPQGCEDAKEHIEKMLLDDDRSVLDTCGYISNGKLYGFVNVYKDTIGYLSGGGNYGLEEISHGVIFEYEPETDAFTQVKRFDDCNIVAYNDAVVLYWKNKSYYSYDLSEDTEKFLIEDKAFDTGIQHQSWTEIYTNSKYTTLQMVKAKGTKHTEYFYLYDYTNNEFTQLSPKSDI